MTSNLRGATYVPYAYPQPTPVRRSTESGEAQNDRPGCNDRCYGEPCVHVSGPARNTTQTPRRMVAVTVALSEPMDSEPLDWPATIASLMRLTYANTTVEVIDTWRVDG